MWHKVVDFVRGGDVGGGGTTDRWQGAGCHTHPSVPQVVVVGLGGRGGAIDRGGRAAAGRSAAVRRLGASDGSCGRGLVQLTVDAIVHGRRHDCSHGCVVPHGACHDIVRWRPTPHHVRRHGHHLTLRHGEMGVGLAHHVTWHLTLTRHLTLTHHLTLTWHHGRCSETASSSAGSGVWVGGVGAAGEPGERGGVARPCAAVVRRLGLRALVSAG